MFFCVLCFLLRAATAPNSLTCCTTPRSLTHTQEARFAAGARRFDFDAGLAPYDLPRYAQWRALSGFVAPGDVERLMPVVCALFSLVLVVRV